MSNSQLNISALIEENTRLVASGLNNEAALAANDSLSVSSLVLDPQFRSMVEAAHDSDDAKRFDPIKQRAGDLASIVRETYRQVLGDNFTRAESEAREQIALLVGNAPDEQRDRLANLKAGFDAAMDELPNMRPKALRDLVESLSYMGSTPQIEQIASILAAISQPVAEAAKLDKAATPHVKRIEAIVKASAWSVINGKERAPWSNFKGAVDWLGAKRTPRTNGGRKAAPKTTRGPDAVHKATGDQSALLAANAAGADMTADNVPRDTIQLPSPLFHKTLNGLAASAQTLAALQNVNSVKGIATIKADRLKELQAAAQAIAADVEALKGLIG